MPWLADTQILSDVLPLTHFDEGMLGTGIFYDSFQFRGNGVFDPCVAALRAHMGWDIAHYDQGRVEIHREGGGTWSLVASTEGASAGLTNHGCFLLVFQSLSKCFESGR